MYHSPLPIGNFDGKLYQSLADAMGFAVFLRKQVKNITISGILARGKFDMWCLRENMENSAKIPLEFGEIYAKINVLGRQNMLAFLMKSLGVEQNGTDHAWVSYLSDTGQTCVEKYGDVL